MLERYAGQLLLAWLITQSSLKHASLLHNALPSMHRTVLYKNVKCYDRKHI